MIQRLQSIWLLLASACAFLSIKFPFFYVNSTVPGVATEEYNATNNILLLVLTSILGALLLFLIFFYKNRKLQRRLCVLALVLSAHQYIFVLSVWLPRANCKARYRAIVCVCLSYSCFLYHGYPGHQQGYKAYQKP